MEVLAGQVSIGLNGVKVLWTMFEQRIQPLKQRVHPLYDYSRVKDLTHKSMEELEANVVMD